METYRSISQSIIEEFFNDHVNITDVEEPKNFILYELERLGNLIEDE